jgi:hypothetical protein
MVFPRAAKMRLISVILTLPSPLISQDKVAVTCPISKKWPVARLVEPWNSFAGLVPLDQLKPVKRFADCNTALHRI